MNRQIKNGMLHCHSDNSRKDSPLTITSLVRRAAELGCPAIALTDHGTLMGIDDFVVSCEEHGIKPILGVEAYVMEDNDITNNRAHLILMAMNNSGYKAISKAVTLSNTRLKDGFPLMNKEIIKRCFGEGGEGYGNVIATSACMNGVLASALRSNNKLNKIIAKKEKTLEQLSGPEDLNYLRNKEIYSQLSIRLEALKNKKIQMKSLAGKSFKKKENKLENLKKKNAPDFAAYEQELLKEKEKSAGARIKLRDLERESGKINGEIKAIKEVIKSSENQHERYRALSTELLALRSSLKTKDTLYKEMMKEILFMQTVFGENFYIELQYHGVPEEREVMTILAETAKREKIPVVATNDVHIENGTYESIRARQLVKSLRFNKYEPLNLGDSELYIKTDEELKSALCQIIPEDIVKEAMSNIGVIVKKCNAKLIKENHYPKFPTNGSESAAERLIRLAKEGIPRKYPASWTADKQKRFDYEMDVIKKLGLCDYFCIVQDFVEYGKYLGLLPDNKIEEAPLSLPELKTYVEKMEYDVGEGVGPGRGSGAASVILYLTGITNIDPFLYDLVFERFLNLERVSMADIDTDFKTNIRGKVISYVKQKYGEDAVCGILTKGVRQAKGSLRDAARILGDELHKNEQYFYDLADNMCKSIPNGQLSFKECEKGLRKTYKNNSNALQILDNAVLIENQIANLGMHAAGIIISDNDNVSDYVPLMWDSENRTWKCQCDMVQAEERGLLKMDFLGLKNLDIITDAFRLIKKRTGKVLHLDKIPFSTEVFKKIYSLSLTNSVFQFESSGMKNMLKRFKPETIEDLILLVAAYRPGPMQYLDEIIDNKVSRKKIKYDIPELEPILSKTYGKIIYQEQIMQIAMQLAGYTLGQADLLRRAMSKKKESVMEGERGSFVYGDNNRNIAGCVNRGIEEAKANKLFDDMIEFAKYAFNKSHAAAYAIISYATAYLKYTYPIEFMTAVMNHTETKKIAGLINDCINFNINVLAPDINISEFRFSITNEDEIIFGLNSVKDVGKSVETAVVERKESGRFTSFKDYMLRGHMDKASTETLIKVGAFDSFNKNRQALLAAYPKFEKSIKKIKGYEKDILKLSENNYSEDVLKTKTNAIYEKIEKEKLEMSYITIPIFMESKKEIFEFEKDKLGVYVSGHPLDEYALADGDTLIEDIYSGKGISFMGIITDYKITETKKDKRKMAVFVLEDKTSIVKVCCFPKVYEKFETILGEGNIVRITGKCEWDDEYEAYTLFPDEIKETRTYKTPIIVSVSSIADYMRIHGYLLVYQADLRNGGFPLIIHDKLTREFRKSTMTLSSEILYNTSGIEAKMSK